MFISNYALQYIFKWHSGPVKYYHSNVTVRSIRMSFLYTDWTSFFLSMTAHKYCLDSSPLVLIMALFWYFLGSWSDKIWQAEQLCFEMLCAQIDFCVSSGFAIVNLGISWLMLQKVRNPLQSQYNIIINRSLFLIISFLSVLCVCA